MSEPVSELMKLAAKSRPRKRNSKLDPYLDELRELQSQGYSLAQMEEFLAQINVTVSRQTIHDFLKRRANTPQASKSNKEINGRQIENLKQEESTTIKNNAGALTAEPKIITPNKNIEKHQSSTKNNLLESLNEQREAIEAKKFKHDPTGRTKRGSKDNG